MKDKTNAIGNINKALISSRGGIASGSLGMTMMHTGGGGVGS